MFGTGLKNERTVSHEAATVPDKVNLKATRALCSEPADMVAIPTPLDER